MLTLCEHENIREFKKGLNVGEEAEGSRTRRRRRHVCGVSEHLKRSASLGGMFSKLRIAISYHGASELNSLQI